MKIPAFYELLLDGLESEARVEKIVRGVSWTGALLSDGSCGVAMHTLGETRPRIFETLEGLPARQAARAALSWNFEEAGEGIAVINACYNTAAREKALGCFSTASTLEGVALEGKTLGFVGHLVHHSGITAELVQKAEQFFILERDPKDGDYPDSACEYLLPDCSVAVITGSAAVNKTMPRLLELARGAQIILTGPSVPLCPGLLELGISRLNGSVIDQPEQLLREIPTRRMSIGAYSHYWTLDKR